MQSFAVVSTRDDCPKKGARLLGPGGLSIFRSQKKLEARVGFEPTSDATPAVDSKHSGRLGNGLQNQAEVRKNDARILRTETA